MKSILNEHLARTARGGGSIQQAVGQASSSQASATLHALSDAEPGFVHETAQANEQQYASALCAALHDLQVIKGKKRAASQRMHHACF